VCYSYGLCVEYYVMSNADLEHCWLYGYLALKTDMKIDKQNFIFCIFFQFYEFVNQLFNEESMFSVTKISKYPFRVNNVYMWTN